MKAVIGVSAIVIAALTSPGAAFERASLDDPDGVQVAQATSVDLPALRLSEVSGTPISLNLATPTSGVRFIKISAFPEILELSRGFRLGDAWVASISDLDDLELITPPGLVKTIRLEVLYFQSNKAPPAAQRSLIVELVPPGSRIAPVSRPVSRKVPVTPGSQPPAAQQPPPPSNATISAEQETDGLKRGATLMGNSDIASARLVYEDLALRGSAKGARALAETYDPAYLKGVFTAGLQPNPEKAKIWYGRAAELGDTVSLTRLGALDRR